MIQSYHLSHQLADALDVNTGCLEIILLITKDTIELNRNGV
jgi:hypothetical protein